MGSLELGLTSTNQRGESGDIVLDGHAANHESPNPEVKALGSWPR